MLTLFFTLPTHVPAILFDRLVKKAFFFVYINRLTRYIYICNRYCGSYYQEISKPSGICDWCRSSDQPTGGDATKSTFHYSKTTTATTNKSGHGFRSTYFSGEKIKQQRKTTLVMSSRNGGATSSLSPSRPSPTSKSSNGRRYKLLKDVLY